MSFPLPASGSLFQGPQQQYAQGSGSTVKCEVPCEVFFSQALTTVHNSISCYPAPHSTVPATVASVSSTDGMPYRIMTFACAISCFLECHSHLFIWPIYNYSSSFALKQPLSRGYSHNHFPNLISTFPGCNALIFYTQSTLVLFLHKISWSSFKKCQCDFVFSASIPHLTVIACNCDCLIHPSLPHNTVNRCSMTGLVRTLSCALYLTCTILLTNATPFQILRG